MSCSEAAADLFNLCALTSASLIDEADQDTTCINDHSGCLKQRRQTGTQQKRGKKKIMYCGINVTLSVYLIPRPTGSLSQSCDFYPFLLGWKMSSLKLIAQNYVSKMTAGLKQTINNGNTTTGCLALFIQSWWLISYLEFISCCAINELWLKEASPSVFLNDSAWVTTVKKINSFTCSVCCDWTTNHIFSLSQSSETLHRVEEMDKAKTLNLSQVFHNLEKCISFVSKVLPFNTDKASFTDGQLISATY